MLKRLLDDERGSVQSTEYILMIVLLAIGGIVGLVTLRDQLAQELADAGVALEQLDQSYVIATPNATYDPADPFDTAAYIADPGNSDNSDGFTISTYDDTVVPPPTDPVGAAPGGMTFTASVAGSEKVAGVSNGDSN